MHVRLEAPYREAQRRRRAVPALLCLVQRTDEKCPYGKALRAHLQQKKQKRQRWPQSLFLSPASPGALRGMLGCASSNRRCLLLLQPLVEHWWTTGGAAAAGSAPGLSLTSHLPVSAPDLASGSTPSSPHLPPGIPRALWDCQR